MLIGTDGGFYVTYDRNYSYLGVRGFSRPGDFNSRVLLLSSAYATLILAWPLLAFAMLGLADTAFDIRGRVARRRGPPAVRT